MAQTREAECPECSGRLNTEGTETVCGQCGLVVDEYRIDHGPEWRSFADDETSPERTGAPLTQSRHDRGLSTDIGRSTRVKGRKRRRLSRMRTQHNRAQISSKRERNQVYAFTEIRRLVGELSLPRHIRESSCSLFRSAQDADLLRGRSLEGFASATVYATCRVCSVSRTVEEIVAAAKATADEHRAAYRALNRELDVATGPIHPAEYIPRYATELDLSEAIRRDAETYARRLRDSGDTAGRNPSGVAAACLYAAARDAGAPLTQRMAADVADVTPVTIRNTYTLLQD
ncbi:transcription initiation factor IIB [Haloplanus halobius]|uniref:transcription initiation factor IIB n=1 Tax=Haloplanus halobius TaxID=2934938 RepID=UPI0020105923|nr:transcription initiation factor IIB family protein [Haloplanus sp. XH21]